MSASEERKVLDPPGKEIVMLTTGERIRLWRNRLGLTLKELAAEIELSARQLSRYEDDLSSPPGSVVKRLARRLGVSADYLLGLKETPTPSKLAGQRRHLRSVPLAGEGLPRRGTVPVP